MFYIKLKDGREFSTDKDGNDAKDFYTVLNAVLGEDAAELYDNLIAEAKNTDDNILKDLKKCINQLKKEIDSDNIDKERLNSILSELKDIYIYLS